MGGITVKEKKVLNLQGEEEINEWVNEEKKL